MDFQSLAVQFANSYYIEYLDKGSRDLHVFYNPSGQIKREGVLVATGLEAIAAYFRSIPQTRHTIQVVQGTDKGNKQWICVVSGLVEMSGRSSQFTQVLEFTYNDQNAHNILVDDLSYYPVAVPAPAPDADRRSIYVGQVDYHATEQELREFFNPCGQIIRAKIQRNRETKAPKGYAFIEFASEGSVQLALQYNGTLFKNRQLKVAQKRPNLPGMHNTVGAGNPGNPVGHGGSGYPGGSQGGHNIHMGVGGFMQ